MFGLVQRAAVYMLVEGRNRTHRARPRAVLPGAVAVEYATYCSGWVDVNVGC